MKKRAFAPAEQNWNRLEDLCPRAQVLGFHSYLRDEEIRLGRRMAIAERHQSFLTYARGYPMLLLAYETVFGHITS